MTDRLAAALPDAGPIPAASEKPALSGGLSISGRYNRYWFTGSLTIQASG